MNSSRFVHGSTRGHRLYGCECAACIDTYDEELRKARERKLAYRGVCEECGAPTTGCDGQESAPKLCLLCYRVSVEAKHGTNSKYTAGCRCDECRAAHRAAKALFKGKEPPTHGNSGYTNYGCRCDVCRDARASYQRLKADERRRYPSVQRRKAA